MNYFSDQIYLILDSRKPLERANFKKRLSTIDYIFTVNRAVEGSREYYFLIRLFQQ